MSADSAAAQPLTPDSLIEECLAGDQRAWEQIVRQNWRKVFNVAYKFVGKHDEAEDLTQDIFLKIFRRWIRSDRRANFRRGSSASAATLHRSLSQRPQGAPDDRARRRLERSAAGDRTRPIPSGRAPGPAPPAAPALETLPMTLRTAVVRDLQELSTGDRPTPRPARGHGEVAHQSRAHRAGAPAEPPAGASAGPAAQTRRDAAPEGLAA